MESRYTVGSKVEPGVFEFKITRAPNDAPDDTVHGASAQIMRLDRSAPDFEFRMQAIIKRLVHHEKASDAAMGIMRLEDEGRQDLTDRQKAFFKNRCEYHLGWARKPDEEIVTWSVATHRYTQMGPA